MIYAIDPGPERSGIVQIDGVGLPHEATESNNHDLCDWLKMVFGGTVAIEDFTPYGQRLGHESIATIKWIGRFIEAATESNVVEIPRPDVKLHLCGVRTAKDADVRDALIHRFGPGRERAVGTKKAQGPLYGIKTHLWAALAVGITAYDRIKGK